MRNKLMLSAALAVTMLAGAAVAEQTSEAANAEPAQDIVSKSLEQSEKVADPGAPGTPESPDKLDLTPLDPLDPKILNESELGASDSTRTRQQASIISEGDNNTGDINQQLSREGIAGINQDGDNNFAGIVQADEEGGANVFGTASNLGAVEQDGDGNFASINQTNLDGDSNRSATNTASIAQYSADDLALGKDAATSDNGQNVASIVQNTQGGEVTAVIQQGTGAVAGAENFASVSQTQTGGEVESAIVSVFQRSEGSSAFVDQSEVNRSEVIIEQTGAEGLVEGDGNIASVVQLFGEDLSIQLSQDRTDSVDNSNPNDAVIFQEGARNHISVAQSNDNNVANVFQSGEDNTIVTEQSDDVGVGLNEILVNQSGFNNGVYIDQDSAPSVALVDQSGEGNTVTAEQTAGGSDGTSDDLEFNSLVVFQDGSDNAVNVLQENDGNFAFIDQSGFENTINLEQSDGRDGGINDANLTQSDVAFSEINVLQNDSENDVRVDQSYGERLKVSVEQSGRAGFNSADIYQTGWGNDTHVEQVSTIGGQTNDVIFDQSGRDNLAAFFQEGGDNSIDLGQSGLLNVVQVEQVGSGNNVHGVQSGSDNLLEVFQEGDGNTVYADQSGWDNVARVGQYGNNNEVNLDQGANSNIAFVSQDGNDNTAIVSQGVDGNYNGSQLAHIEVFGNHNTSIITQ